MQTHRTTSSGVTITGGTGMIGQALIPVLIQHGYSVTVLTRTSGKAKQLFGDYGVREVVWDPVRASVPAAAFDATQAVINLMGAPVYRAFLSLSGRHKVYQSRVDATRRLVAGMPESITKFISASAIGYYPPSATRAYTATWKNLNPGTFLQRVCVDWEAAAQQAQKPIRTVCIARFGLIFSEAGGISPLLARIFRTRCGIRLGTGAATLPWIALPDVVGFLLTTLQQPLAGVHTVVAPEPCTTKTLLDRYSEIHKPLFSIPIPTWVLRLGPVDMTGIFHTGCSIDSVYDNNPQLQCMYPSIQKAPRHIFL